MSSFASRNQKTIPNPFEPGVTFTIQKLSGGACDRAQAEHIAKLASGRDPRGWEGVFRRALASATATDDDVRKAAQDPLAGYDRMTVVKAGLKAWSYTEDVDGKAEPKPITPQAVDDDLDDETIEYLAIEIMRLTKPARFVTAEEAEAVRKNA